MANTVFLVIVEVTYLNDGAYLEQETQIYWVTAQQKRNAAATVSQYVKHTTVRPLASVRIIRVVANSQWGTSYFTHIREHDGVQEQQ